MKSQFLGYFFEFRETLVANARFSLRFWCRLHLSKVENLIWVMRIFLSDFDFFELRDVFRTFKNTISGYHLFWKFFNFFFEIKIQNTVFINETALRASPAVTRLTVHRRLQYRGVCLLSSYAVFEICYLAIERKRFLEIWSLLLCIGNFTMGKPCVRSILSDL